MIAYFFYLVHWTAFVWYWWLFASIVTATVHHIARVASAHREDEWFDACLNRPPQ